MYWALHGRVRSACKELTSRRKARLAKKLQLNVVCAQEQTEAPNSG